MANNYSQWSASLDISSEAEYLWLKEVFSLDPYGMAEEDEALDKDRVIAEVRDKFGLALTHEDFEQPFPNFDSQLSKDNLWVYAEEFGDVDNLGRIVQAFLRKFRPDDCFYVTWADSCSKMRIDEFGGGAMFVTSEKIETFSVYDWVAEKLKHQNKK